MWFQWNSRAQQLLAIKLYIMQREQLGRFEPPIASQSTPDTQELSSTSHQAPLPPSGCFARAETLLLKFLYPEAKAFNGHCFACYMRRWQHNHLPRLKLRLWQLRQAIYYSIILNISGDQQDAIMNISAVALQKEVALHLSGIDQEGSRFPKREHNTFILLSPNTDLISIWKRELGKWEIRREKSKKNREMERDALLADKLTCTETEGEGIM